MRTVLCLDHGAAVAGSGGYFRMLLIGYFEGIDSERGIAWRAADFLALWHFLGLVLQQMPARSTGS